MGQRDTSHRRDLGASEHLDLLTTLHQSQFNLVFREIGFPSHVEGDDHVPVLEEDIAGWQIDVGVRVQCLVVHFHLLCVHGHVKTEAPHEVLEPPAVLEQAAQFLHVEVEPHVPVGLLKVEAHVLQVVPEQIHHALEIVTIELDAEGRQHLQKLLHEPFFPVVAACHDLASVVNLRFHSRVSGGVFQGMAN